MEWIGVVVALFLIWLYIHDSEEGLTASGPIPATMSEPVYLSERVMSNIPESDAGKTIPLCPAGMIPQLGAAAYHADQSAQYAKERAKNNCQLKRLQSLPNFNSNNWKIPNMNKTFGDHCKNQHKALSFSWSCQSSIGIPSIPTKYNMRE